MKKQEVSDENIDSIMFSEKDMKRSALHKKQYLDWMKKRNFPNVNKKYLYYPDEMRRNMEIKNVFINIDKDGSRALDMKEIYDMFRQYNFNIQKEDLEKLFKVVDDDKDNALNWREFKKCALDDQANIVFTSMMRKLRDLEEEEKNGDKKLDYIPMNFGNMISFLSYCSSRDDIYQAIFQDDKPIIDKFEQIQNLFKLTDEYQQHQQQMSANPHIQTVQTNETLEDANSPKQQKKGKKSDLEKFFKSLQKKPTKSNIQPPKQYDFKPTSPKESKMPPNLFKNTELNKRTQMQNLFRSKPGTKLRTTLPQNLKEIDQQITKCLQQRTDQFTSQDLNKQASRNEKVRIEKLNKLRKEVDQFIDVAKSKYNLEIDQYDNSFLDKKANILASDLKQELLQFQPNFKHFSQYSSENNTPNWNAGKRKKLQQQNQNQPKNPQLNLRNTSSVPTILAKDLKFFRSIDKNILYNNMGHTFYTRYVEHPIYAQDLLGSNKYKEVSTAKNTQLNTAFQSTQNSLHLKESSSKQKELYQSQDGIVFSLRDKPFNSSHQSTAKRLYGTGYGQEENGKKWHQKTKSDAHTQYGRIGQTENLVSQ